MLDLLCWISCVGIPGFHTQSHGHPKKSVLLRPRPTRMESCWVYQNVRSPREDHTITIDWGEGGKTRKPGQSISVTITDEGKSRLYQSECNCQTFTDPQCHLPRTSLPKYHMFSEVSQKITGLYPSFRHWGIILGW